VAAGKPMKDPWSESDRRLPRTVVQPLQRLMDDEAAGGVVMLIAAAAAIAWANSPWADAYVDLWATPLQIEFGDVLHLDHLSLQTWVNDALMTLFFLMVGLEIKREAVHGELRDLRTIAVPVLAALGGMVVPAAIFAFVNRGTTAVEGWAVPMATDIAFAVGVVTLLGRRVPLAAKVFLLTLAVADDIGAIVVIAVFYTGSLSWGWLLAALTGLAVIFALRRGDVQSLAPYLAVGAFVWLAALESGVHATLVGVVLGLLTPAWPLRSPRRFPEEARRFIDRVESAYYYERLGTGQEFTASEEDIGKVARLAMLSTSPLERLERGLGPWVAYVVVPVFALANAGVKISGDSLGGALGDPVTLGVVLGLVVGKTLGVFGATAIAVKAGVGPLPGGTTWRHLFGLSMVAGIGFTVALFVTSISFTDPASADAAKLGILVGSLTAGVCGYVVLRSCADPDPVAGERPVAAPVTGPAPPRVEAGFLA
jgi:NhaA family Na+:H+ antiporter